MFSSSEIDPTTIQAYLDTEYRVHGGSPATLRVGEVCSGLAVIHKAHRVDCSAFITACNPFSAPLNDEGNAQRQAALEQELARRSLAFVDGTGQHPTNQWPGERNCLALGLTLEAAKALGSRLQQNAIIWSGPDAMPQLILLR